MNYDERILAWARIILIRSSMEYIRSYIQQAYQDRGAEVSWLINKKQWMQNIHGNYDWGKIVVNLAC